MEDEKLKQRGLMIIYDPHALMQFLQFYCMGDYEAEWDALCLPKENGEEEMHLYCKQVGIFRNIYIGKTEYQNLSVRAKFKLFIPMVLYGISGQRKKYCTYTLNKYIENVNNYNILAANTESGFISGMIASFGKEKTVIFFEDGIADYIFYRNRWKSNYRANSFENLQSVLMARLGYFGKGYTYLKPTKETIKYCSAREELLYKNYKEVREFSMDSTALKKFKELSDRVYHGLENFHIDDQTAIVFTDAVENDYDLNWEEYVDKFIKVICQKHDKILLKCHPRENVEKYSFPNNVTVEMIPRDIPAELILPYLHKNDCYFMMPDSILINMQSYDLKIHIVHSEYIQEGIKQKYLFLAEPNSAETFCERFVKGHYDIIRI